MPTLGGAAPGLWCSDDDDVRGAVARHQRGRREKGADGRAAHPDGRTRVRRRPYLSPERKRGVQQRRRGRGVLAEELSGAIEKHFGFGVGVLVRDHAYLRAVREACPFPAAELEGRQLHVTYFSGPVGAERFVSVEPAAFLPEEFRLGDRVLYLYAPDGLGRSKLAEALAKPRLLKGVLATTRNWNTVVKLEELTGA